MTPVTHLITMLKIGFGAGDAHVPSVIQVPPVRPVPPASLYPSLKLMFSLSEKDLLRLEDPDGQPSSQKDILI